MTKKRHQVAERIARRLLREAREAGNGDWSRFGGSNVERDRYVQGLRDAAAIARQIKTRP